MRWRRPITATSSPSHWRRMRGSCASGAATTRRTRSRAGSTRCFSRRAQRGSSDSTPRRATPRSPWRPGRMPSSASRNGSARSVPSPYGRCLVSLRFANAMSEKWMWNGAPGSRTVSARARASRKRSASRNAPSLVACMWAKSTTGRTQPARRLISTQSSSEPRSRTRPITSIPNGTARSLPSSRSRTIASCPTTESIASSRLRPSRKPGWKTTTSAPQAAAIPALRSRAPSADDHLRPLASRCPTHPNSGAWTDSATSFSRASSPKRSAHG